MDSRASPVNLRRGSRPPASSPRPWSVWTARPSPPGSCRPCTPASPALTPSTSQSHLLLTVPSSLWSSKLAHASALNPDSLETGGFGMQQVNFLPTLPGLYAGFLSPPWLVLFLAFLGLLCGLGERWLFRRCTPARFVLLAGAVIAALVYEAGLPAMLVQLRAAAAIAVVVKVTELARGRSTSPGPRSRGRSEPGSGSASPLVPTDPDGAPPCGPNSRPVAQYPDRHVSIHEWHVIRRQASGRAARSGGGPSCAPAPGPRQAPPAEPGSRHSSPPSRHAGATAARCSPITSARPGSSGTSHKACST